MTRVLDELEAYLDWRGFSSLRLDGASGSAQERGDLVRRFNDPGGAGGGCGLMPGIVCRRVV
jgi:SNF2 family DNA or RNA helicase